MDWPTLPPQAFAQVAAVRDGQVRVGPLVGVPRLLSGLGRDPATVIRAAGVDPRLLDDPEGHIDFAVMGRVLAHCAASTGCPHFGLLLGQRFGLADLGLVGLLVQQSPDVEQALRNLVRHLPVHDRGAVATLVVEGDRAVLGYAIYQPGVEGVRQIYDLAAAIGRNVLRTLCGPYWRPIEVRLPHRRPAPIAPFDRFFQAPVRFDAERAALVFTAASLRQPLRGADRVLHALLEARIGALEAPAGGDIGTRVRGVLRDLLLGGRGSLEETAQAFAIHPRTLNRRLRERGLTFRGLLDESRYDMARQLLRETELTAVAIAAVLDYAEAPVFTRAFRRWSGTTPTAWRAAQGGE